MSQRTVHVLYTVDQDEDGVWCADAQIRVGVGAHGYGDTESAAVDDLREALIALFESVGVLNELNVPLSA